MVTLRNMTDARAAVVAAAAAEIGPGDTPKYWHSCGIAPAPKPNTPTGHWCGAFALWALHQAGLALRVMWRIGLGFCEVQKLSRTTTPKPGDILYIDKPFQHHGIVESFDGKTLVSIEGNTPTVRRRTRTDLRGITFYSIQKFLDAAPPVSTTADPDPAPPPSWPPRPTERRVLRLESPPMHGPDVSECRWILGLADGGYDADADRAVRAFQRAAGLTVDGIVGHKQTWPALRTKSEAAR